MADVKYYRRSGILFQDLKTAGPTGQLQALSDMKIGDIIVELSENLDGSDRKGGIKNLMFSRKRGLEVFQIQRVTVEVEVKRLCIFREIFADQLFKGGMPLSSDFFDRLRGGTGENAGEDGDVFLDYAGFLKGNFAERISEDVSMVVRNIGNNGKQRQKGVGGIKSASETGFDYGNIDFIAGEIVKSKGGAKLEKSDFIFGDGLLVSADEIGDILLVYHLTVNSDSFSEIYQVRRSENTGLITCLAENGIEEGGSGAFAIGAGDMDRGESSFRVIEVFEKYRYIFQSQFDTE